MRAMSMGGILQAEWLMVFGPALLLGIAVLALLLRRAQVRDYAHSHKERAEAKERGSSEARLQHPDIDLSLCLGCGACIRACPEEGVLSLLHGQAVVVHGARCVGHGLCADACPPGAIALTLGDLSQRRDLPALTTDLEVVGVPGLFLAGEVGGFALVRTALTQGVAAADAAAQRIGNRKSVPARSLVPAGGPWAAESASGGEAPEEVFDLLVVGAGPGGLACSLRAKELGLNFVTIEQEPKIGGTVASYPRRKLVMTQPVDLPLHGRLPKLTYLKEELVELWQDAATGNDLPIRCGVRLLDLTRSDDGVFAAKTATGVIRARNVCMALGRRGTPRKLGIPGEDLPKVAYSLLDAESYQGRKILVVGGGDSAVEAAVGLSEQPGNEVTISYRKKAFFRLKGKNETKVQKAIAAGHVRTIFESDPVEITAGRVVLKGADGVPQELANDEVFIFAGGDPPFALLERAGVSFDPKDRPEPPEVAERKVGVMTALVMALVCAVVLAVWGLWFRSYYGVEPGMRAAYSMHALLRPAGPVGLAFGLMACALFLWNLAYLLRRSPKWGRWMPGSLSHWMRSHVFTGMMAVLCVLVHAGFTVRPTVGGHAFVALAVVIITGCVGRYIYALIPHAANGTESSLDDLRGQLATMSAEWDREGRGFGMRVHHQIDTLITEGRWRAGLLARIGALIVGQFRLGKSLRHLQRTGLAEGISQREIRHVLMLARKAYRLTLLVTHYEEVRAVLSSWRYFHRWLGILLVLLAVVHIVTAARYATLEFPGFGSGSAGSP